MAIAAPTLEPKLKLFGHLSPGMAIKKVQAGAELGQAQSQLGLR